MKNSLPVTLKSFSLILNWLNHNMNVCKNLLSYEGLLNDTLNYCTDISEKMALLNCNIQIQGFFLKMISFNYNLLVRQMKL